MERLKDTQKKNPEIPKSVNPVQDNGRPGYKHTPLGWIPEEWEVKKIRDFGKVVTGNTPPTTDMLNYGNDYMFVGPGDVGKEKYISKSEKSISKKGYEYSRKLPIGSVLFICIGSTIGKVGIVTENSACNQQINAIICNNHVSHEFLYYELLRISPKIKLLAGEQAVPIINKSQFENFHVIFPNVSEQQKIAAILSTWDEAITKTQQIIAQLQQRNKGLMQQLLTGKKRLKGFEKTKWHKLNADEIFKPISIKNNGNEQLLSATQDKGIIPRTMLEGRVTMPSGETNSYKLVEPGDFIISLRSFQGGLEYSEYRGIVSPAYTVLKPRKPINDSFYKYYFKSYDFIGHLAVAVIGIRDGKQISFDDFCVLRLPYPPVEEQKAIAGILNKADDEVKLNQQKLSTLQQQKKGLMQKLLTGEVRVKI
jgi:type I restriction enzyme S subunit